MSLHLSAPEGTAAPSSPPVRAPLSGRRLSNHRRVEWKGRELLVSVGFDDMMKVREIFADGHKVGSEREAELDDFCIMASLLLQSGWTIEDLQHRLSRQGIDPDAPAATIFGFILKFAAQCEKEPLL